MKKLFALLLFASCSSILAATPIKDLRVSGTFDVPPSTPIPAVNIDWSKGQTHYKTLSANTTFTFSNTANTKLPVEVAVTNTASNYTVAWPASVIWEGGVIPTQTVGAKTDVYTFKFIGAQIYGSVRQNYTNQTPSPTPTATATATATSTATATATPTASPAPTATATATATPTATPNSPDDIPGLILWIKADAQSFSDNDPVGTAVDSSGTTNNATASGTERPTFKTGILNSLPVFRFDGTDDRLTFTTAASTTTTFVVARISVASSTFTDYTPFIIYDTAGAGRLCAKVTTNNWGTFLSNSTDLDAGEVLGTSTWNVLEMTSTTGSTVIYRNGVQKGTAAFSSSNGTTNFIGAEPGTRFLNGDIAEVITYNSVLSTGNRTAIELYLASKYGL